MKKLPEIIIIDDDEVYREVLARSLTRLNCLIQHFSHPLEALSVITKIEKPIILLDLKLESDSGLRWIKQLGETCLDPHIVLLTGYASISTAVEAIKLGANDYLAKPITAREILNHLKQSDIGKFGEETEINENPMSVERLEWEHLQKVLHDNDGNISATARALGMHRRTLQRKLAKKPVKS